MALLERQEGLAVLGGALDRARTGHRSLVLVTGEAGIGKSTLVREVIAGCSPDIRVFVGSCDALSRHPGVL